MLSCLVCVAQACVCAVIFRLHLRSNYRDYSKWSKRIVNMTKNMRTAYNSPLRLFSTQRSVDVPPRLNLKPQQFVRRKLFCKIIIGIKSDNFFKQQ